MHFFLFLFLFVDRFQVVPPGLSISKKNGFYDGETIFLYAHKDKTQSCS